MPKDPRTFSGAVDGFGPLAATKNKVLSGLTARFVPQPPVQGIGIYFVIGRDRLEQIELSLYQ